MYNEALKWLLDNNGLVIVPSKNDNITGDIGFRSRLIMDPHKVISDYSNNIYYSEDSFYLYRKYNISHYLIMLNGKVANPIYSDEYIQNTRTFKISNFPNNNFSSGDRIVVIDKALSQTPMITTIASITNTEVVVADNISITPNIRYKIINYTGDVYSSLKLVDSNSNSNPLSQKLKFGCYIYDNP